MKFIKTWIFKKKNIHHIVQSEIKSVLKKQEIEHIKDMNELRKNNIRLQNNFEQEVHREVSEMKKKYIKECKKAINIKEKYYSKLIEELEKELKEAKEKVSFVKEFWRSVYSDKEILHNVSLVLQEKMKTIIDSEKNVLMDLLNKRAKDYKDITLQCEKLDKMSYKLKKMSNDSEKLLEMEIIDET